MTYTDHRTFVLYFPTGIGHFHKSTVQSIFLSLLTNSYFYHRQCCLPCLHFVSVTFFLCVHYSATKEYKKMLICKGTILKKNIYNFESFDCVKGNNFLLLLFSQIILNFIIPVLNSLLSYETWQRKKQKKKQPLTYCIF